MDFDVVIVMVTLFIGLPWIILHYITRWKTAATLTGGDERLLEELQGAALRLDFEKAGRLRRDIRSVQSIVEEQTRLRDAEELHNLLLVLPSADPEYRDHVRARAPSC